MKAPGPRGRVWLAAMLAALAAIAVYANSLPNHFAYDDYWIIQSRGLVHSLGNLGRIWTEAYWPPGFRGGLYRPLVVTTYALGWALWHGNPLGFHLVNVLLHASVSALVVLLLLELFPWWAALAGGVVFAIHPVHTEAVANVVGRAELLTAAFALWAALVYVRRTRRGPIGPLAGASIALAYALAMLSKESGVVLPGLLLALDLIPIAKGRVKGWGEYIRSRAPLFAVLTVELGLYLAGRRLVLGSAVQNVTPRAFALDSGFATRLLTMARVWPRYFELLVAPTRLSADYSPAVILPATGITPLGALGFVLVGAVALIAILGYRRAPEFGAAAGWAGVALLPVCNLLVVVEIVLAERTLYLPSVAVALAVALALTRVGRPARSWLALGVAAWVVGFSVVTVRRNPVWRDTQSVLESLRHEHPESSRLLWEVGEHYRRRGDWRRAKEWYHRSLEIWPYHGEYLAFLSTYLRDHGELEEAERMIARAVRLEPNEADYHTFLALVRLMRDDPRGAVDAARRGLRQARPTWGLYRILARAHSTLHEHHQAVLAQRGAIRVAGRKAGPADWLELAALQAATGDTTAALATVREGRDRNAPRDSEAFNRAETRLSGGKGEAPHTSAAGIDP